MVEETSEFTVRIATKEDAEKLFTLTEECEKLIPGAPSREKWQAAEEAVLENPDFGFLAVCENAEKHALGFVYITYEWSDWRNGVFFWIQQLFVTHDYRKKGVFD